MFRRSEIENLQRQLPPDTPARVAEQDLWRLQHAFFGSPLLPQEADAYLLLVGARSGLEAALALTARRRLKVVVVEGDDDTRSRIRRYLKAINSELVERLTLVGSMPELSAQGQPMKVGVARIDLASFKRTTIEWLLSNFSVDHLCGEMDPREIDPLALYRMCRTKVSRQFWRVLGSNHSFCGVGATPRAEVSVIIPAYNVRQWIDRCLESLAKQTLQLLEVIVVDDGSSDDTGRQADEWASRYPGRLRVVHKQNGGCASARMAGLKHAQGQFVGFVDADDWVDPRMYEELYRAAVLHSAEVAQCGYREVFERSGDTVKHLASSGGDGPFGLSGLSQDPRSSLATQPSVWRRIYLRKFLLGNGIVFPEHIRRFDDLPFQLEVLARIKRIAVIPDCYYSYRLERQGQDAEIVDSRLFVHFDIFDWLADNILAWADAEIERYFVRFEINSHLWALSRMRSTLRRSYMRRAACQFMDGKRHLGTVELLRIGASLGPGALPFVIRSLLTALFESSKKLARPPSIKHSHINHGDMSAGHQSLEAELAERIDA